MDNGHRTASLKACPDTNLTYTAGGSNKHLILGHGPARLAAAAVPSATVAEQKLDASSDALKQAGKLTYRRNHGLVYQFGSFLHTVKRASEQFVSADDLQACAVHRII